MLGHITYKKGYLYLFFFMLSLLLLIPILGSLILLPIPEDSLKNQQKMKQIALFTSLINLILSI